MIAAIIIVYFKSRIYNLNPYVSIAEGLLFPLITMKQESEGTEPQFLALHEEGQKFTGVGH